MNAYDEVKESERQFHNQRFGGEEDSRQHLDKWYRALHSCKTEQDSLIRKWGKDRDVLEYGCADGKITFKDFDVGREFKSYNGIDISDKAIEQAVKRSAGLTNCSFHVMDAEHLTFSDASFDVVFGTGIIHHLDVEKSLAEIHRVLRPNGKAIFNEPLGHNPMLNFYRSRTPHLRTPDEHPLLVEDFKIAGKYFRDVDTKYFGMTTVLAVPTLKFAFGNSMMKLCEKMDSAILKLPYIKRHAWSVLMVLTK